LRSGRLSLSLPRASPTNPGRKDSTLFDLVDTILARHVYQHVLPLRAADGPPPASCVEVIKARASSFLDGWLPCGYTPIHHVPVARPSDWDTRLMFSCAALSKNFLVVYSRTC